MMMGADNKILKVSYGIFSCSLEGFEEPFDVMRTVALLLEEIAQRNPKFGTQLESEPLELVNALGAATKSDVPQGDVDTVSSLENHRETHNLDRSMPELIDPDDLQASAVSEQLQSKNAAPVSPILQNRPPQPAPAPKVQSAIFSDPQVEDPSEQILLDAKEELARELAKIETEIVEERAKQERLRQETAFDVQNVIQAASDIAQEPSLASFIEESNTDVVASGDTLILDDKAQQHTDPGTTPAHTRGEQASNSGSAALEDTSVTRILEQTNWEMDKPEGSRRRSAIAHLRAAVAATRADRFFGQDEGEQEREEAYRGDLEDAVRPHQMTGTGDSMALDFTVPDLGPAPIPQSGVKPRKPPLKLVAEQRVDHDYAFDIQDLPPPPKALVRTRRAMASTASAGLQDRAEETSAGGFATYAAVSGAESLDQLMEAAAAYMTFVEHRDQFSRPQLMNKMREAETQDTPREDRLRIFADLLRDCKVVKVGGGRFIATDKIGFQT
jgi:hypothetical protein